MARSGVGLDLLREAVGDSCENGDGWKHGSGRGPPGSNTLSVPDPVEDAVVLHVAGWRQR
ncbi:hypothetical protein N7509_000371 [Penicillium cosmopolitanum]|uniref:Uncharacterized protein n=1 Tax=Penicillium cosmopolitanum TaxID=1131564 RepID=A0A9W9WAU7_9EURO|nr:uncharacterized protein N7509_000371 [Penicillium cosmopolitanum]KAJ5413744.1 hypothetical protein N7509_000371 [Penicillium cosmopolitanum]